MRSAANVRGHPLHPALIPFPFAFLFGATIFDVAGLFIWSPSLWTTAAYMLAAGIATGLLAAVPGLIDYLNTVPPDSSAKARATKHMLVNVSAIALFAAALWMRGGMTAVPAGATVALEVAGVLLLSIGGWMGGTLVYRNQIGVDMRYANAGKWTTKSFPNGREGAIMVAKADELGDDQMMLVKVGGRRIVVARTGDEYVAFDDHCPHRGGSLAGGALVCGTVQCPWHGSQFDVRTGAVQAGPAESPIHTWTVHRLDGSIWLSPSTEAGAEVAGTRREAHAGRIG